MAIDMPDLFVPCVQRRIADLGIEFSKRPREIPLMPHALLVANEGFTVATAGSLRDARRQMALQEPDIVLLDLVLPDGNGMELFQDAKQLPNAELVLITGHASLDTSIQALRLGAADYLVKPMSLKQLQGVLSRVTKPSALKAAAGDLESTLE